MPDDERSEWQRRYDESLVREQATRDEDGPGVAAAVEVGGCLGSVFGWVGAGVALGAGLVAFIRQRKRTKRAKRLAALEPTTAT